jgi:hypothetical protein
MWQFVYSNAAPVDETVNPPIPEQKEKGDLGRLLKAIECGAPIRVGMLRSGTIHYSVFTVENVRYWKTDDNTDYVALASLVIASSNLNYDPTQSTPGFGPWYNGVSVDRYHTPAIAIVDTKGNERFWKPGDLNPWLSSQPRVFRWYADIDLNVLMRPVD